MTRIASKMKIAAFAVIVGAPLVGLVVLGAVAPYGQRLHPEFPTPRALLNGKHGSFDQLGRALLDRSAVTKEAIRLKYAFNNDVTHYVDAELVVSGRGDWLFYKDDFSKQYVCLDEPRMTRDLAQVDVMTDVAAAAGLRMFVSVSPDKSSVYPEYLHPLARGYWACKIESAANLRRLIAAEAPRVIDHGVPLLAEKAASNATNLFFHQDTHWSPLGAALALRQLFAAVLDAPVVPVPPPQTTGEKVLRHTDMGNLMLLLPEQEKYDAVDKGVEERLAQIYAAKPAQKTVMLNDSFYTVARFNDATVFPGIKEFHIDKRDDALTAAVADAEHLIINSVERSFLARIEAGALLWSSGIGRALVARNMTAAQACDGFQAVGPENLEGQAVVAVPANQKGRLPCVRITLETTGMNIEISLPRRVEGGYGDVFAAGRSVLHTLAPGRQVMTMILPGYVGGRRVGVRQLVVGAGFAAQSIEVGSIASP